VNTIEEIGGFVQLTRDRLRSSGSAEDKEAYESFVSMIANFSLQMVIGISKVSTARDNRNNLGEQLPAVLPPDLWTAFKRLCVLFARAKNLTQAKVFRGRGGKN